MSMSAILDYFKLGILKKYYAKYMEKFENMTALQFG
jgi:hypothetical protein